MSAQHNSPVDHFQPKMMQVLAWYAIASCVIFPVTIFIADWVVPNHDWIADTISDLGAGRYEFIVDIGLYTFSAGLIATALMAAHLHLGKWDWSVAIICLAALGLIVFLIGARNEYGDNDNEGVVIHSYLVYALGALMAAAPVLMIRGAVAVDWRYGVALGIIAAVWAISAPVFFMLPTDVDGVYERYLGLISFAFVLTLARLFLGQSRTRGTQAGSGQS